MGFLMKNRSNKFTVSSFFVSWVKDETGTVTGGGEGLKNLKNDVVSAMEARKEKLGRAGEVGGVSYVGARYCNIPSL